MISPWTPIGTKVECIKLDGIFIGVRFGTVTRLMQGGKYTVLSWMDENYVQLAENPLNKVGKPLGFHRSGFRRVTDISSLKELLHTAPIDADLVKSQ